MNDTLPTDSALSAHLAHLRRTVAHEHAPRGVEKELMTAFAAQFARRRWYHALSPRQWTLAGASVAMAAMVALTVTLSLALSGAPSAPPSAARSTFATAEDGPAFVALQPMERIAQETNPRVLEADVPRTALASLGLPVDPQQAGDSVRAEMLVGADGSPLALRLLTLP